MPAFLVGVVALDAVAHSLLGAQQSHATTSNHAFFHCSAGGVQGVFDASLLFLHFDFGGSANLITATPPASLATRSCSFSRS